MTAPKVFESEYRFCLILWENEPIGSADLARLCRENSDGPGQPHIQLSDDYQTEGL